jgi:hypothetical protein
MAWVAAWWVIAAVVVEVHPLGDRPNEGFVDQAMSEGLVAIVAAYIEVAVALLVSGNPTAVANEQPSQGAI